MERHIDEDKIEDAAFTEAVMRVANDELRSEIARLREELRTMTELRKGERAKCESYDDENRYLREELAAARETIEHMHGAFNAVEERTEKAEQREREALAVVEGIANMTHAKMRDSQDVPMNGADYNLMFREWAQSIARHLLSRASEQENNSAVGGE